MPSELTPPEVAAQAESAPAKIKWLPRFTQREVELEEAAAWRIQLAASILCLCAAIAGAFLEGAPSLAAYVVAYLAGSWFTAGEAWEKIRSGSLDIHFLMLAVAGGAAVIGEWGEGATLLFLFSLSGALENYALQRTQREIRALFNAAPKTATIIEGDVERTIEAASVTPGMRLLVRPGQLFPVDAEVVKGETAADESNLTGEAVPVPKTTGDTVFAGTLNQWGAVEAVVIRRAQESALQKIIHLIQHAQRSKAPAQLFTDRFGTGYTYSVLLLTALMFFVWWQFFGYHPFITEENGESSALYRAMTLLVVASPCALVLSIPSAILAAIAWGARRGVLFRGGAAVEQLGEVQIVALDKTGTLTTGELGVELVESYPAGREKEIVQLAASLDRQSTHPLARAIVRHAKRLGVELAPIDEFVAVSGSGVMGSYNGIPVRLGRREWAQGADHEQCRAVPEPKEFGVSEVWLSAGEVCGRILLRDQVRPEAPALIGELRKRGLRPIVLTGDKAAAAEALKRQLSLDDVRAGLTPAEKLAVIQEFARGEQRVAMIGDGVNDAPSVAAAHVGVAMGARGSDAALEQADIVLMHDRLENFVSAFDLSIRARRIIRENLAISLGVICVLVVLALSSKIPLTAGVVGHEGSTLVVVLNSLRLLGRRE